MPFELRPYPTPTLRPEGDYLRSAWERSVYPLAEKLGVTIRLPEVSPQPYTRLAHEGLEFARENGRADAYNHEVFVAFFQRSENIGSLDVLASIAAHVGLDEQLFRDAIQKHHYSQKTDAHLREAYELGVTAVPTMLIGRRVLSGLYPEDVLKAIIQEELEASRGGRRK